MKRFVVVALLLVVAGLAGLWWWSRGDVALPPPSANGPAAAATGAATADATGKVASDQPAQVVHREAAVTTPQSLLDDPEIRAGLSGFKGRVVTHTKIPVPDCGVRIYRGAMDSILTEGVDIFADAPTLQPQYIAGETRTANDGTFLIPGVWPRGFYVMFAGIGTDAPTHRLLTATPGPGEVVDLGDVELPDAGVITGTVLDENGDPLAGALVRAADLPGALAAFFPVERFDPKGAVLVREARSPIHVVEMPRWVEDAFEHVPIPTTRSDAEGHFRLVGVIPGSNLLATTKQGFLSDMKPSVQVRAGQTKDVGSVKLKRGEELTGKVVDTAGKPVAGAEVFAGSTLAMAPVDLAQRIGDTDAEGRFTGTGFSPGKVTVAARRGKGQPWVLAEPQPVLGEVVVTLPATFGAEIAVTLADNSPAKTARFRLLSGRAGDGAAEMAAFGFVPPIDLKDRLQPKADGHWRIENLSAGRYTLVADAQDHATAFEAFVIEAADVQVTLQLPKKVAFPIRVLGPDDKPIRNAAVYAEARGKTVFEMPLHCGRTAADGRLSIEKFPAAEGLRVSVDHPRWGTVHGEAKAGEELVLRMQAPGSLHGLLTENGKPAPQGQHTIGLERRRGDGPSGPLEQVPQLLHPAADGTFGVQALQPGEYRVHAIKSLDALRSPGGVFSLIQDMMTMRDIESESVQVVSGQVAEVRIDAGEKPLEGPTAHLAGSVTVDGRLAAGYVVNVWGEGRRFNARVDERGRFDAGQVPAKDLFVSLLANAKENPFGAMGQGLWSSRLTLQQGEQRELTIEITTSSISGICLLPDGSPAAGVNVQAQGKLKNSTEEGNVWFSAPTDAQGRFHFEQVAEGTYALQARGHQDDAFRGRLEGVVVNGGVPVDALRLELQKAAVVKGRVDYTAFGNKKPRWCWIGFYKQAGDGQRDFGDYVDGSGVRDETGEFTTSDLPAGRYCVRVHAMFDGDKEQRNYRAQDIEVGPQGAENLLLRPVPDASGNDR